MATQLWPEKWPSELHGPRYRAHCVAGGEGGAGEGGGGGGGGTRSACFRQVCAASCGRCPRVCSTAVQ
eukprot:7388019-Prymnesium_polylepis.2